MYMYACVTHTYLDAAPCVDGGRHDLGRGPGAVEAPEGVHVAVVVGHHLVIDDDLVGLLGGGRNGRGGVGVSRSLARSLDVSHT